MTETAVNRNATTTAALEAWLTQRVTGFGVVEDEQVTTTTPLADLGLDSVYALTLCGDIEDTFDLDVEPTIAWDHPTIEKLAAELARRING